MLWQDTGIHWKVAGGVATVAGSYAMALLTSKPVKDYTIKMAAKWLGLPME